MHQSRFHQYIASMTDEQLNEYATCCGTSAGYLTKQLKNAYRMPRQKLMAALVLASDGNLTRDDVLEHFYPNRLFSDKAA